MAVRLTSRGRFQTGPAAFSAGYRYTTNCTMLPLLYPSLYTTKEVTSRHTVGLSDAGRSSMGTLGRRTTLPGRQPQCMMHDVLPGKRSRLLRPCAAGENATGRRNTHAIVYGKYQGRQPGYGTVRRCTQ